MRLHGIHTYPIKGCYRVDQDTAEVQPWGLAGDRRWVIVNAQTGRALTQREVPRLTGIKPTPTGTGLILRTADQPDLTVESPVDGDRTEVRLFSITGLKATFAGAAADDWLTTALGLKVQLVWQDDPTTREVGEHPGNPVSFADGYPLLLANMASLNALNDLIVEADPYAAPLPMTRFRPNLVISGAPAWIEDDWTGGRVRIGDVTFRVPKPCGRCRVTATDQETGQRGREPLMTLGRHRLVGQQLLFATNLIPDAPGTLTLGAPVTVL